MTTNIGAISKNDLPVLRDRAAVNPYRYAYREIYDRLRWDLKPESWRSRHIIRAYQNKYVGRKAIIVCNGPSLLKTDFGLLENVFTFGLNKINLLFNKSDFRPSCIVAVNSFVIEQNAEFYNKTDIPLFLDRYGHGLIHPRDNVAFLHSTERLKFARDCSMSIYQGYTVTFVAMQLAFHMGFKEVALIGCDHNFATKGPANMPVRSGEKDDNHFDSNYFAGGVKWQLPDLAQSEISYGIAREVYESSDRRIVNSSEGGKLEIFERMPLAVFLSA